MNVMKDEIFDAMAVEKIVRRRSITYVAIVKFNGKQYDAKVVLSNKDLMLEMVSDGESELKDNAEKVIFRILVEKLCETISKEK